MIPENKMASMKTCGSPLTTNCVWAQGQYRNISVGVAMTLDHEVFHSFGLSDMY